MRKAGLISIVLTAAIFVFLHFGLAADHFGPRVVGTTALGGLAFLAMTASILLSTRLQVLENMFGGLDRMYQVHRVLGVSALLLISKVKHSIQ